MILPGKLRYLNVEVTKQSLNYISIKLCIAELPKLRQQNIIKITMNTYIIVDISVYYNI